MLDKPSALHWIPEQLPDPLDWKAFSMYKNAKVTDSFFRISQNMSDSWTLTLNFRPLPQPHPSGDWTSVFLGLFPNVEAAKDLSELIEWQLRINDVFEELNLSFEG